MSINEILKDNKVEFSHILGNSAFYVIRVVGYAYVFPIDLSDIGSFELKRTDKAIAFAKFITKAIAQKKFTRVK